jgi:hypothetical protein
VRSRILDLCGTRMTALLLNNWTVECVKSHPMFSTDAIARSAHRLRRGPTTEGVSTDLHGGAAAWSVRGRYGTHAHQVHSSTWIVCYAL